MPEMGSDRSPVSQIENIVLNKGARHTIMPLNLNRGGGRASSLVLSDHRDGGRGR
jgi:hypothetical protein